MFSSKKKNSPEKNAEKPVENLKVIYNAVVRRRLCLSF